MGAQVASMSEQERAVIDTVLEESAEGEGFEQQVQMNAMAQLQNGLNSTINGSGDGLEQLGQPMAQSLSGGMPMAQSLSGGMPIPSMQNVITPGQISINSESNGEGIVTGAGVPGMGPVITIRTDAGAYAADGILPDGFGMGRQPRRNPFRGGMGQMMQMGPMAPRYIPMDGGNGMASSMSSQSHQPITITKLE